MTVLAYAYHLLKMKRFNECVKCLKELERNVGCMNSNACRVYRGLSYCYNQMKLFETAEIYFKLGIQHGNDRYSSHYEYGIFLFEQMRYEEAEIELKYSSELYTKHSKTCFYLSKTLLKLKKYKEYEHYLNWTLRLESLKQ